MKLSKDQLLVHVKTAKEKLLRFQRFTLWFKLMLLAPAIGWFLAFNFSAYIPPEIRPHIDTRTLPYLESKILGGRSLQHWPRNLIEDEQKYDGLVHFLDLLSAFVYVIHFCFVWFFAIGIYVYYRKRTDQSGKPIINPWTFFWCWGWLNFISVMTQLCWPTAPPWYIELYGNKPPSYSMGGDPAGLENADHILNFPLFGSLYGKSPIVFGSFPSLHGAWPIMITIFAPSSKIIKFVGTIYVVLVWWAAMYLNHHFLVDLIGGLLYVIVCYVLGMLALRFSLAKFKERIYSRGGLAIVRVNSQANLQEMELLMVETHEDNELEEDIDLEEQKPSRPNTHHHQRSRSKEDMILNTAPALSSYNVVEVPLVKEQTVVHPSPFLAASPVTLTDLVSSSELKCKEL
jgi:membrane-associated phospholipid phosphatase